MHSQFSLALFLAALSVLSQTVSSAQPDLPKDSSEILTTAAPFYDFNDPSLKPWHLKASYQLYDQFGRPAEQGTYEYWWASPKVYRSTWTRPGVTQTSWNTTEGYYSMPATGAKLKYFEDRLQQSLFSPLPDPSLLNSDSIHLSMEAKSTKGTNFRCVALSWTKQAKSHAAASEFYCFDQELPDLRAHVENGEILTQFNKVAKFQGKYLASEIVAYVGKEKMFTAQVDTVDAADASDPALIPAPGATLVKIEKIDQQQDSMIAVGRLVYKLAPSYPLPAKEARQQGEVFLDATIGVDGKIRELEVIHGPSKSLNDAALVAVSQWRYTPYLLNGQPTQVHTVIKVMFSLGG